MWEERARLAAEMRASGMQQKEWCEERGINPGTFRWWIERLKELEKAQGIKESTPAGWIEVLGGKEIGVKDEPSATAIDIRIGPYTASVRPGFDKAFLAEVCEALSGIC
jgi:hypothetical protein